MTLTSSSSITAVVDMIPPDVTALRVVVANVTGGVSGVFGEIKNAQEDDCANLINGQQQYAAPTLSVVY